MATVDVMFEHLEDEFHSLNQYEQNWVSWLQDYYRKEKYLSAKQKMVLRDIYFRHSDGIEEATAEHDEEMFQLYLQVLDPDSNMSPQEREHFAKHFGIVESAEELHEDGPTSAVRTPLANSIAADPLAELLIEKGIIKKEELLTKLTQVRERYQNV